MLSGFVLVFVGHNPILRNVFIFNGTYQVNANSKVRDPASFKRSTRKGTSIVKFLIVMIRVNLVDLLE